MIVIGIFADCVKPRGLCEECDCRDIYAGVYHTPMLHTYISLQSGGFGTYYTD